MSVQYSAIKWNRNKRVYDGVLLAGILLYLGLFYLVGLARRALSAELRQRGIPDSEVRSAVGMLGPQDELATARRLVARRIPASLGKPAPARARQLMGMLARKGYSAGLAAQVVREALEQEQENDAGHRADLAWISEDGGGDDWL